MLLYAAVVDVAATAPVSIRVPTATTTATTTTATATTATATTSLLSLVVSPYGMPPSPFIIDDVVLQTPSVNVFIYHRFVSFTYHQ